MSNIAHRNNVTNVILINHRMKSTKFNMKIVDSTVYCRAIGCDDCLSTNSVRMSLSLLVLHNIIIITVDNVLLREILY